MNLMKKIKIKLKNFLINKIKVKMIGQNIAKIIPNPFQMLKWNNKFKNAMNALKKVNRELRKIKLAIKI
jgi:hypothetical protein